MIEIIVYLILGAAVLVGGVLAYMYLAGSDIGLIARLRNFLRFGGWKKSVMLWIISLAEDSKQNKIIKQRLICKKKLVIYWKIKIMNKKIKKSVMLKNIR